MTDMATQCHNPTQVTLRRVISHFATIEWQAHESDELRLESTKMPLFIKFVVLNEILNTFHSDIKIYTHLFSDESNDYCDFFLHLSTNFWIAPRITLDLIIL